MYPSGMTKQYHHLINIGELRNQIIATERAYPQIVFGGIVLKDDNQELIEHATYRITLTRKYSPKELSNYLLNPENTDLATINRQHMKFACSGTGGQDFKPLTLAMDIYSDEERATFFRLLHDHFTFDISIVDKTTLYDKNNVEILLSLFQDKGMMNDCPTVDHLYSKKPRDPHFMDFIHIMFGEIQHIPGGPEPLFTTVKTYDYTHDLFFENLHPDLQEIILTLRQIVLGY